jgi:hypothetical protein
VSRIRKSTQTLVVPLDVLGLDDNFLNMMPKAQATERKNMFWSFTEHHQESKKIIARTGRKYLQIKGIGLEHARNSYNTIVKKR